ncbi:MAG: glycosyltransferase [Capsulimonas sp.]|uniref:glycosyltransferase n=1 Tax=Capsulimonas sp. TaxID=2494211 RepID=UPI0032632F1A
MEAGKRPDGVEVVVPHLPGGLPAEQVERIQEDLLGNFFAERKIDDYVFWYYTPMAIAFTKSFTPRAVIYDAMDELSAFQGAPPELLEREQDLYKKADLVFTGGQSIYEAKRSQHPSVHAFPSSVDVPHFAQGRELQIDPADQTDIAHPRIGFYGVIDERADLELLEGVAKLRPGWSLIMIGPVVKIDEASLPKAPGIHYLGGKSYAELPSYLSGWDVAMLPFARNESTRFISPTKTPEYLAAGKPVVSTSIKDVVRPYGDEGLVKIADTPEEFVTAVEELLSEDGAARQTKADELLGKMSWDITWGRMSEMIDRVLNEAGASVTGHERVSQKEEITHV